MRTRSEAHARPAPRRTPRLLHARSLCAALVAALALSPRSAEAVVLLEAYVGPRPANASTVLAPLYAALEVQGMVVQPHAVRALAREGATRSAITDPSLSPASLVDRVTRATELLHKRSYGAAAGLFESALSDAYASPGLLVADRTGHAAMMDAWIGLATSRVRMGDHSGAEQAMQEVVRSFPDQETNVRNGYGAEPAERYRSARKQLQARGAGKLVVTTNDPSALIYVNEGARPQNAIFEADALPGTHRVLVQLPGTTGWRYDVVIEPNQKAQLDLDVRFLAAVVRSDAWIGFSFSNLEDARRNLVTYAGRLLAASEHQALILVSLTAWNGQPAVVASLYRLDTGAHVRGFLVALDGREDAARLRSLANGLVDKELAEQLTGRRRLTAIADPFAPLPGPRPAPRPPDQAKWALLGGAALAAGAGVALVSSGEDTAPYGHFALGVAATTAAVAAILIYRDTRERSSDPRTSMGIAPAASGLLFTVGGRF